MRAYRVTGGPARIGAGELVGLTPAQFASRSHVVAVAERTPKGVYCRPREAVEFKAGEIIMLPEPPAKGMAQRLVPVDGEPDGRDRAAPVTVARPRKTAAAVPEA